MTDWWSYPTNYSNTSIDGVGKFLFTYPNEILGGTMGAGIIVLLWIMTFVVSMVAGSRKAMLVASFVGFVFSVYFWRIGIINPFIIFIMIILMIVGAIGSKEESSI